MNIGEAILKCRHARQLRQSEIAERAGISVSYLSLLERGLRTDPSVSTLQGIAEALNIPLAVLVLIASEADEAMIAHEPALQALSSAARELLEEMR